MAEESNNITAKIEAGLRTTSEAVVDEGRIVSIVNAMQTSPESQSPEDYNKESAVRLRWTTVPGGGFTGPDDPNLKTFIMNFQTNEMQRENADGKINEDTLAALWEAVKTEGPNAPDEKKQLSEYLSDRLELFDPGVSQTEKNIMNAIVEETQAIRRQEWGALNPNYPNIRNDWYYKTVVIHHLGNDWLRTYGNHPRGVETRHMAEKGWGDVGYHYMVSLAGEIFEGRLLLKRGAHTEWGNIGKLGILALGDFQHQIGDPDDDPTTELISGIINLINIIRQNIPEISVLGGHRDFKDSVCPGDVLYARLPDLRTATGLAAP
jgi:hypothetical protein